MITWPLILDKRGSFSRNSRSHTLFSPTRIPSVPTLFLSAAVGGIQVNLGCLVTSLAPFSRTHLIFSCASPLSPSLYGSPATYLLRRLAAKAFSIPVFLAHLGWLRRIVIDPRTRPQ